MLRRCVRIVCAIIVYTATGFLPATAQQPGFSQINVHNPFSSHYVPMTPIRGNFSTFSTGVISPGGVGTAYSFYSPGYFAPAYYPYVGYPYYGGPVFGGAVFAPLVLAPDTLFGPRAMMRFMGVDNPSTVYQPQMAWQSALPQQQVARPAQLGPAGGAALPARAIAAKPADPPVVKAAPKQRTANAEARARAQRFIVLGDGYFAKQAYSDANQRYKLALTAAPDAADAHLHQGLAFVALGHYDAAARSLTRGISLAPQWADSGFTLNELYGQAGLAKAAHIEALVQETQRAPSADSFFLLGVMQFFDGKGAQALPAFLRSRELAGGDDAHLDGFLRKLQGKAAADEAPAPAAGVAGAAAPAGERGPVPAVAAAPRAGMVAPFAQLPAASDAPRPAPSSSVLPRSLRPAPDATDKPPRDL